MSDGTNNITILLAGRPYPLKVKEGDEQIIRRIVKELNDKIALFQENYARKDRQDWLAMALLTYAVDLHKAQSLAAHATPVSTDNDSDLPERLSQIDALLAAAIDN